MARARPKRINLALQGGGSHGAYAWGVLDQFLADGRVDIEGISGTSASPELFQAFKAMTGSVSPYQCNPFDWNPFREALVETVDFERVSTCKSPKLFLAATNVETGRARIFTTPEVSVLRDLSVPGKFSLDWKFLQELHARGLATGKAWLAENYAHLGRRSSTDLRKEFL